MIGNFRALDLMRFGFAPVYLAEADVARVLERGGPTPSHDPHWRRDLVTAMQVEPARSPRREDRN